MAWDTAANIINDAAVELGLIAGNISEPFASADQNIIQLCRLAKGVGQDLVRERDWAHLVKEYTFATVNGQASYPFPFDFERMVDRTQWNRTQRLPTPGGISPQAWQQAQALSASGVVYKVLRAIGGQAQLYPTPTAAESCAYEYVSGLWVALGSTVWAPSTPYEIGNQVVNGARVYICDTNGTSASSGGPHGTGSNITDGTTRWDYSATLLRSTVSAGDDLVLFDRRLFVAALRLVYRDTKGFDTTADVRRYQEAFARAAAADGGGSPVLSLNSAAHSHLVDGCNAPETGFGS